MFKRREERKKVDVNRLADKGRTHASFKKIPAFERRISNKITARCLGYVNSFRRLKKKNTKASNRSYIRFKLIPKFFGIFQILIYEGLKN